jgi:hypothetical protein
MDDYVSMILTSELPDDSKVSYLRHLNTIQALSENQLIELEDKIYDIDHKKLTEKDKLTYEANFLYAYYKDHNLDLTDIRRLYYKISRALSSEVDINNVKMYITQLQLDNGLGIRFYKSYLDLLEKMEKEKNRKPQRTFHK